MKKNRWEKDSDDERENECVIIKIFEINRL